GVASLLASDFIFSGSPVIQTSSFTLSQNGAATTVIGLSVSDSDATGSETFTMSTVVDHGTVNPPNGSGTLAQINSTFATGITYDPGVTPPAQDKIALTVTDGLGNSDRVN